MLTIERHLIELTEENVLTLGGDVQTTNQKKIAFYKLYTNNTISVKIFSIQITARHVSPLSPILLLPASSDTGD